MKTKVRVGNARCMCHGHHVRKADDGQLVSEFGVHDGNRTYIERTVLKESDPLYQKATALFRLHNEEIGTQEKIEILRLYGRPFRTFVSGRIKSAYIGDVTVDGRTVAADEKIFISGDLIAIAEG